MRAVLVSWSESTIEIRAVFDSAMADADAQTVGEIESEMMSHFPDHTVSAKSELSTSARIEPAAGEAFVFMRACSDT